MCIILLPNLIFFRSVDKCFLGVDNIAACIFLNIVNDLICTADEAYLPGNSFPALLKFALKALGDSDAKPKSGSLVIEKDGRTFEYDINENGQIKKLTANGELVIEFDNIEKSG